MGGTFLFLTLFAQIYIFEQQQVCEEISWKIECKAWAQFGLGVLKGESVLKRPLLTLRLMK